MRDLHTLTRRLGLDHVARIVGVSPRALKTAREGSTALTVDVLWALVRAFDDFDLAGTVARVGAARERRHARKSGWNGKRVRLPDGTTGIVVFHEGDRVSVYNAALGCADWHPVEGLEVLS